VLTFHGGKVMKDGYRQGDMDPEVKDYQTPASAYAESFDQAPLRYIERNNRMREKEASKVRSQKYMGRYD